MGSQILELRQGRGEPSSMALDQGTVVDPTSVGTAGMWRIVAPGVLEIHGYVYFDGNSLYVQSADDRTPILVNKHRVATAWTEVRAPSTIELGKAEIVYRDDVAPAYDDGDPTLAAAPGGSNASKAPATAPSFVPGGGAFANRSDDESTRFAPIEGMPVAAMRASEPPRLDPLDNPAGARSAMARPAAGAPAMGFPPPNMDMPNRPMGMMGGGMGGGMQGMPPGMQGMPGDMQGMPPGMQGMPPGMQGMPPGMQGMQGQGIPGGWGGASPTGPQATVASVVGEQKGWEKVKADWEVLPPMRRALYIMAPFVFSAACFVIFFDEKVPPPKKPKTAASSSASGAAASASVSAGAAMIPSTPSSTTATPPTSTAGGTAATTAPVVPVTVPTTPTASSAPETPPRATKDGGSSVAVPPLAPGKKTTERAAADAWAEGNYPEAARMYEELATQSPGNPAYKEAARILREKMAAPPSRP